MPTTLLVKVREYTILLLSIVQSHVIRLPVSAQTATIRSSQKTIKIKNSTHLVRGRFPSFKRERGSASSYQMYGIFNFHSVLSWPDDGSLS
jgi:hypothetical protein